MRNKPLKFTKRRKQSLIKPDKWKISSYFPLKWFKVFSTCGTSKQQRFTFPNVLNANGNVTEKQTWTYLQLWHWSTLGPQQRPLQERWHFWPAHKDRNDQCFWCVWVSLHSLHFTLLLSRAEDKRIILSRSDHSDQTTPPPATPNRIDPRTGWIGEN